jgi:hypothetical protein
LRDDRTQVTEVVAATLTTRPAVPQYAVPNARPIIVSNFEAWSSAIADLIAALAGRLPPDVEPAALAKHVLATMEGPVMLARAYHSFEPFDQAVHQLRDYLERLLRDGSDWNARNPDQQEQEAT